MSYIKDDKILIECDKALIMKNIRVSLIYGILSLIVTIFLAYLFVCYFMFSIAVICIMTAVLFGFCVYGIVMNIKHLKSGNPLLEADDSGISSESILVRGFIPWNNVKRIYLKPTVLNGKDVEYIELELCDKESYINTLNANDRRFVNASISMGHEAVSMTFSSSLFQVDTEEIMNDLITLWERNK